MMVPKYIIVDKNNKLSYKLKMCHSPSYIRRSCFTKKCYYNKDIIVFNDVLKKKISKKIFLSMYTFN